MALLDRGLLKNLGIEVSDRDYELLAEHFDTTLRSRVIDEVVKEITSEQARDLAAMEAASDEQLLAWLHANVPNFADIVSDEVDILLGELAKDSEVFNNSSTGNTS